MTRARDLLGLLGGLLLLACAAAHSLAGWPAIRTALGAARVAPDLVTGVGVAWQFGGVMMATLAVVVLGLFAARLRGRAVPLWPVVAIALGYGGFGAAVMTVVAPDPFYLVFVVPGVVLLAAALGRGEQR